MEDSKELQILIVDDTPMNRKLLKVILESFGFKTVEAGNGVEALEVLEREKIDCIVSDMLMPVMTGYQLCEAVRKSEKFRNIPLILFTSTYTRPNDEKLALECGADKYLKKPVSSEVIIREIYQVIEYRKQNPYKEISAGDEMNLLKE